MSIEELGYQKTPLGDLTLRRRHEPLLQNREVYEVKLGDEYLMSSLFTESEQQLAKLGLAPLGSGLDVVVGGLGLGFTALEALKNAQVARLLVIDIFQAVIDWHLASLVPNGKILASDDRCELRQGDFFALARSGFDATVPNRKFDAVLLDIDHTPEHVQNQLKPGGTFALWSNDPSDEEFTAHLGSVFASATAHDIDFPNPYTGAASVNSVYVARRAPDPTT